MLFLPVLVGCDDLIVDGRSVQIEATGTVQGRAFLDIDGDGTQGANDKAVSGLRVQLTSLGGGVIATSLTDSFGDFRMEDVPVGEVRIVLDPATVPDSVEVVDLDPERFILFAGSTAPVLAHLSFPVFTIAEVRALPPGRRVFTHGITLNTRASFGDGVVHLQESDTYLRATNVSRAGFSVGDSVRFLGRTALDQGLPVLDDVSSVTLVNQAALPAPVELTTNSAAGANGGTLDAALVRIRNATILDTVSVGPHLLVTADDGTGPVDLLLRDFVQFNRNQLEPATTQLTNAVGLLVPVQTAPGQFRWRMTPRAQGDLIVGPAGP